MIQYDPHNWMDHFFDVRGSLVREIGGRVTICVIWSAVVVAVHKHVWPVAFSNILHSLVGVALGLLLVFRTNASYDRFWEGRRLWGGIVNESRNLVRASSAFLSHTDGRLYHRLTVLTAVFPWAAMNTLRGKSDLGPIADQLPANEAASLQRSQHTALAVATKMSCCLQEARERGYITDIQQVNLDGYIQRLIDCIGGCERIRKTPLPFAYVVHLRRALVFYCLTLPFALVDIFGWGTILSVLLLAYTLFGIEEIGVEIEGPFGYDDNDLPLEDICATIHHNVFALSRIENSEPERLPEGL